MNGEYGSGSAVGDFGSEIVLDGSVEDIAITCNSYLEMIGRV